MRTPGKENRTSGAAGAGAGAGAGRASARAAAAAGRDGGGKGGGGTPAASPGRVLVPHDAAARRSKEADKGNSGAAKSDAPARTGTAGDTKGVLCHHCRSYKPQTVQCAGGRKPGGGGAPCTLRFCAGCLGARYGETAADALAASNWTCPRCRGDCTCSKCRKRKSDAPPLNSDSAKRAKTSNASSIHENVERNSKPLRSARSTSSSSSEQWPATTSSAPAKTPMNSPEKPRPPTRHRLPSALIPKPPTRTDFSPPSAHPESAIASDNVSGVADYLEAVQFMLRFKKFFGLTSATVQAFIDGSVTEKQTTALLRAALGALRWSDSAGCAGNADVIAVVPKDTRSMRGSALWEYYYEILELRRRKNEQQAAVEDSDGDDDDDDEDDDESKKSDDELDFLASTADEESDDELAIKPADGKAWTGDSAEQDVESEQDSESDSDSGDDGNSSSNAHDVSNWGLADHVAVCHEIMALAYETDTFRRAVEAGIKTHSVLRRQSELSAWRKFKTDVNAERKKHFAQIAADAEKAARDAAVGVAPARRSRKNAPAFETHADAMRHTARKLERKREELVRARERRLRAIDDARPRIEELGRDFEGNTYYFFKRSHPAVIFCLGGRDPHAWHAMLGKGALEKKEIIALWAEVEQKGGKRDEDDGGAGNDGGGSQKWTCVSTTDGGADALAAYLEAALPAYCKVRGLTGTRKDALGALIEQTTALVEAVRGVAKSDTFVLV